MVDIVRSTRSGREWTENELIAYNISIKERGKKEFFKEDTSLLVDKIDTNLMNFDFSIGDTEDLPKDVNRVLSYLDVATTSSVESAVDSFASELMKFMNYDIGRRMIMTNYPISLTICGVRTVAETDVCVIKKEVGTLLLLQEDKRLRQLSDPEPQIIAEAIAAFQENNRIRREKKLNVVDRMLFPCITMVGTNPCFYLIPITEELNKAVITAQYPGNPTIISRYIPIMRRKSDGMKTIDDRKKVLCLFEAFKKFVDDLETQLEISDVISDE